MTGRVLLCPIIPSWDICNSASVTNQHALGKAWQYFYSIMHGVGPIRKTR